MSNQSLIAIVQQANQLEQMLIESGGELTPEIEAALTVTEINLPEKVDGYENVISRFEHLEEFYKAKSQFFIRLQKQCANVQHHLKENIKFAMQTGGIDELKGYDIRFKLSNAKPSLVIEDESLIPKEYKTEVITIEVNKKSLAEDLSMGEIPGAKLQASVSLRKYANTPAKKADK
jgi:hypothetical protein